MYVKFANGSEAKAGVPVKSGVFKSVLVYSVDTWTGAQTWWETGSESRFYQLKDPANTWSLSW